MAMPNIANTESRNQIDISFAVGVMNINTFGARDF
jgi:hypothetical protein